MRVGPKKTLYDLDSVREMVRPIGALSDDERVTVAELVADSPDPTGAQIAALRSVIHGVEASAT